MFFKKELCKWFACVSSESLAKIDRCARKFFLCFWQCFPFLCPRANCSCSSLPLRSFLKSDLSDLFPLLFTKERPWAIRSGSSWQKLNCERFLLRSLMKKGQREQFTVYCEPIILSLFCSQKRVNSSKNLWANSQLVKGKI